MLLCLLVKQKSLSLRNQVLKTVANMTKCAECVLLAFAFDTALC